MSPKPWRCRFCILYSITQAPHARPIASALATLSDFARMGGRACAFRQLRLGKSQGCVLWRAIAGVAEAARVGVEGHGCLSF